MANFEMAIMLPLGVVANQLMKVEADLRFLNAKASVYSQERDCAALISQVAARLEEINEALEAIRGLVADIEADFQPASGSAARRHARTDRDD